MKRLSIPLALFILLTSVATILLINYRGQAQEVICPPGSYAIGDGVCKVEPTGCPYGDSIPMDMCNKFAPPEPEPAPTPVIPEATSRCTNS